MRRSLRFYRHRHVAVAAGAAVACAVLTGALLVGDSVRGSLRDLALERLGATDLALVGQGFVSQTLAGRLEAALRDGGGDAARVVSLLSLPGTAVAAESRARASRVTVLGVEGSFATLWPASTLDFEEGGGGQSPFPPVILNEPLQRELGVEPGDAVVLSFSAAAEVPRGSLMGRRDAGEVLETLRLTVAAVVPTTGPGAFSLASTQIEPLNAFVPLDRLQRALGQPGRINTLLVAGTPGAEGRAMVEAARDRVLELADLGLRLERRGSGLELTNDRFVLRASTVEAVQSLAHDLGATTWPLRSYLANTIEVVSGAGYVG
ncbi:MAG: hypothetical protein KDD11_22960, partial [Acidobacteria bacterium]|nr:hypothetical protein [Acidobacteriota bacterium]